MAFRNAIFENAIIHGYNVEVAFSTVSLDLEASTRLTL